MRTFDEWNEEHGDDTLEAAYAEEEIEVMHEELLECGDLGAILEESIAEGIPCQKSN